MKAFKTKGTCASEIVFDVVDNKVKSVRFIGGCGGQAVGLSNLVEGMDIDDVINRLEGVKCGSRGTSCPDQLAQALKREIEIAKELETAKVVS